MVDLRVLWREAKWDEEAARQCAGGPRYDDPNDEWRVTGIDEFNWWDKAQVVFVRTLFDVAICAIRGHRMEVCEDGNAESGPSVSWGCKRCRLVGGWSSMYSRGGDDASKYRWENA